MKKTSEFDIELHLNWDSVENVRRNSAGYETIKNMVVDSDKQKPIKLNAFLYAFLCAAKNFNLFQNADMSKIEKKVEHIANLMEKLENFERDATDPQNKKLCKTYLSLRKVISLPNARDEQRTLIALLFSGPSTKKQIAEDLGISINLAARTLRTLSSVVDQIIDHFVLRSDNESLAVVLFLLQSTIGLKPIHVLKRLIIEKENTHGKT